MLDFGKELKAAREAKGLTIANIAEKTHIMSVVLEDLENENFSRIVAPIYGRGFVKLYCETVGLDPKPFVAEFMEIYNGRRDPAIRERPVVPPPLPEESPITAPVPEPVEDKHDDRQPTTDEQPPVLSSLSTTGADQPLPEPEPIPPPQPSLFDPPSNWESPTVAPEPQQTFATFPEPVPQSETTKPRLTEPPRFTRYSAPLSDRFADVTALGPTILRWTILVLVALGVLWGVVAGVRALYRATSTPSEASPSPSSEASSSSETRQSSETSETGEPAAPRTPIAVPPLYID